MPVQYSRQLHPREPHLPIPPTTTHSPSLLKAKVFNLRPMPLKGSGSVFSKSNSKEHCVVTDSAKLETMSTVAATLAPGGYVGGNPQAIPSSPNALLDSSSNSSGVGLTQKMFRNLKENLQRVSRLTQVRPGSAGKIHEPADIPLPCRSAARIHSKTRQSREEGQFEVTYRIAKYLTESYEGHLEPSPLFVGEKEPPISFIRYVERLIKLTNKWVEESDGADSFGVRCAILAVDYLERLNVKLGPKAIHRYYMAAYLIAIKLLYDYYISNSFWAEKNDIVNTPGNSFVVLQSRRNLVSKLYGIKWRESLQQLLGRAD